MGNLVTAPVASATLGISEDTIKKWHKRDIIRSWQNDQGQTVFDLSEVSEQSEKSSGIYRKNRYRILASEEKTGYRCVELFAGAGGTALGMANAGIEHVALVENDKDCIATLRSNRPNWNVIGKDVRTMSFVGMEADIVQGGFPCQSFSYAGKSMGFGDTRGTLFFEFARCVNEIRPSIAIGENVRGLVSHDGGKTLATMVKSLNEIGYRVRYQVLRSQYLDVPQKRERLLIVGIREDLDLPFIFPEENNYTISLMEAIGDRPLSDGQKYSDYKKKVMDLVPEGGCWVDLPEDIKKTYMGGSYLLAGGKTGMARRLSWSEPSLTLTCSPSQKQTERCHPEETRPLNIREYARIQTFPDEWEFSGSMFSQYKQIGNAVPVNLGYHIGRCAIEMLNSK